MRFNDYQRSVAGVVHIDLGLKIRLYIRRWSAVVSYSPALWLKTIPYVQDKTVHTRTSLMLILPTPNTCNYIGGIYTPCWMRCEQQHKSQLLLRTKSSHSMRRRIIVYITSWLPATNDERTKHERLPEQTNEQNMNDHLSRRTNKTSATTWEYTLGLDPRVSRVRYKLYNWEILTQYNVAQCNVKQRIVTKHQFKIQTHKERFRRKMYLRLSGSSRC